MITGNEIFEFLETTSWRCVDARLRYTDNILNVSYCKKFQAMVKIFKYSLYQYDGNHWTLGDYVEFSYGDFFHFTRMTAYMAAKKNATYED